MQRACRTVLPIRASYRYIIYNLKGGLIKHLFMATLTLLLAVGTAQADPLFGVWKSAAEDNGKFGHIEMQDCDGKICGTLIKSFALSGKEVSSPNVVKLIVWGMKP